MNINIKFDFGKDELVLQSDITVHVNFEYRIKDMVFLPDMREFIALSIEEPLRALKMSERGIARIQERIRLSGKLKDIVQYPYHYDADNHRIVDERDIVKDKRKTYSVKDFLERKLPD